MRPPFSFDSFGASRNAVIATAIHAGHELRPSVAARSALDPATRLREEDPFTDRLTTSTVWRRWWCTVPGSRWISTGPARAPCTATPDDAWGLELWTRAAVRGRHRALAGASTTSSTPSSDAGSTSLAATADRSWCWTCTRTTTAVTAATHRPRLTQGNPEVNVGTGSLDRATLGSGRRPVRRRAGPAPRSAADARGRAGERPLPRRRAQPLGQRRYGERRVRAGDRVQEGVHGRVDRRARRAASRGAARRARRGGPAL